MTEIDVPRSAFNKLGTALKNPEDQAKMAQTLADCGGLSVLAKQFNAFDEPYKNSVVLSSDRVARLKAMAFIWGPWPENPHQKERIVYIVPSLKMLNVCKVGYTTTTLGGRQFPAGEWEKGRARVLVASRCTQDFIREMEQFIHDMLNHQTVDYATVMEHHTVGRYEAFHGTPESIIKFLMDITETDIALWLYAINIRRK